MGGLCGLTACDEAHSHSTEKPPGDAAIASVIPPLGAASATSTASAAPELAAAPDKAQDVPEGMRKIPAGVYLMGANAALGNPEEKPAHQAIVPSFFMDKTEVTLKAYLGCVEQGGCTPPQEVGRFCNHKMPARDGHPINCVTVEQASAYCGWAGKRLPTEREWEYAATGGTERRRFSWGDVDPDGRKNSCYDHPGGSCPVASFPMGAFGLYDMTGNLWEWTSSEFLPYPSSDEPASEFKDGHYYVYRGGSWSRRFPKWMRNWLRNRYQTDQHSAAIGMRCAKLITPIECPAETEARNGKCVRVSGEVLCETNYRFDGTECKPDNGLGVQLAGARKGVAGVVERRARDERNDASGHDDSAEAPKFTIQRTAQHDADCKRHWPNTPASYLFGGGKDFHSRKPILRSSGCVPRDMGWKWTSACCPG